MKLLHNGALDVFFDASQLTAVETVNLIGVAGFLFGCLAASYGVRRIRLARPDAMSPNMERRLLIGGSICGVIGSAAWMVTIINVGGFVNAFSQSHAGGWDDSGYVRDSSLLLYPAIILILATAARRQFRVLHLVLLGVFALPILSQALLGARRGPTFAIFTVLAMGWFLYRNSRPSSITALVGGVGVSYLILFLIANRNEIHFGSDFEFKSDVTSDVSKTDTGNEFIYGTGTMLSSQIIGKHYWGRRYLAQILVRPIPSAVWPTKYEDFGVPELLQNAGTDVGIAGALGWKGAPGSAPGIVADLYTEGAWLAIPFLVFLGWCYGRTWRLALVRGGPWAAQYAILSALSIYLVMQTMEAVIFRLLLLSIPTWLTWKWASRAAQTRHKRAQPKRGINNDLSRVIHFATIDSRSFSRGLCPGGVRLVPVVAGRGGAHSSGLSRAGAGRRLFRGSLVRRSLALQSRADVSAPRLSGYSDFDPVRVGTAHAANPYRTPNLLDHAAPDGVRGGLVPRVRLQPDCAALPFDRVGRHCARGFGSAGPEADPGRRHRARRHAARGYRLLLPHARHGWPHGCDGWRPDVARGSGVSYTCAKDRLPGRWR